MIREKNEYEHVLTKFYEKSLIFEAKNEFHPVLYFYLMDSFAHIDFSICNLAFNIESVRNLMNMQYMRWRIDEEKIGERVHFPEFINWLKDNHPEDYEKLPSLWQQIYNTDKQASYRSFRIVLDPDTFQPVPVKYFELFIDEFFDKKFLNRIYQNSSLGNFFDAFIAEKKA